MWNIKYLEQLLVRNSPHHMRVYIWATWRIRVSKMNKFSFGFASGALMIYIYIFFWRPVEKNLMNLELPYNFHPSLKLVSAIFLFFQFFFHQMIVLKKLWKMFFISSKKLFSFSRYSNFCIFSTSFPLFPDSVG